MGGITIVVVGMEETEGERGMARARCCCLRVVVVVTLSWRVAT